MNQAIQKPAITSDPAILGGKPIVAGTRIAVSTILDLLASGLSVDDIAAEYPKLTKKAVQSAISFAASRLQKEIIEPIRMQNGSLSFPVV